MFFESTVRQVVATTEGKRDARLCRSDLSSIVDSLSFFEDGTVSKYWLWSW
jgi:hypothetical protein